MNYLITGVVGAGKSSARRLLEKDGYEGIELDDKELSSWINKKTGDVGIYSPGMSKNWLEEHSWIVDKKKLAQILSIEKGVEVFVSGIPSNINDILDLFDAVFLLQISADTISKRLVERTEAGAFGKSADEIADIMSWKDGFIETLIMRGAISIDAEKSVSEVVEEILLKRLK